MSFTSKNSLIDPAVRKVIDAIGALQTQLNPTAEAKLRAKMHMRSEPFPVDELVRLCAQGSFACPPEIGRLLYALVRAIRPKVVVEFGTSHGFSTLHIAAALRDNGKGHLVGSELHPDKVAAARKYLADAGLADWVEIREGYANETLVSVRDVDLLYLDGWADFYLDVLKAVEPNLRPGAFVQADDIVKFGSGNGAQAYLAYVRDPANGYVSITHSDYQGFEQSSWAGHD